MGENGQSMTAQKTGKKRGPKPWTLTKKRLEKIYEGAKAGQTEAWIAESLGIGYSTFQQKKNEFSEISGIIKKGRDEKTTEDIAEVQDLLLMRCRGVEYMEETIDRRTVHRREQIDRKTVTKRIQPSDTAIIFFLCNRDPEHWQSIFKKDPEAPQNIQESLDKLADAIMEADSTK